jgi:hypothetical protein
MNFTFGPKMSSIAPDTTDILNRKRIDIAPSHAIVDVELDAS